MFAGGLEDHYFATSCPVLPRLAITAPGIGILKRELGSFLDTCATILVFYVVDVARESEYSVDELECASRCISLNLEDGDCARLLWWSFRREWEVFGNDGHALSLMRRLIAGLDDLSSSTSEFDLEIRLVRVTARKLQS